MPRGRGDGIGRAAGDGRGQVYRLGDSPTFRWKARERSMRTKDRMPISPSNNGRDDVVIYAAFFVLKVDDLLSCPLWSF